MVRISRDFYTFQPPCGRSWESFSARCTLAVRTPASNADNNPPWLDPSFRIMLVRSFASCSYVALAIASGEADSSFASSDSPHSDQLNRTNQPDLWAAAPSPKSTEWAERTPRWPDGTVQRSFVRA